MKIWRKCKKCGYQNYVNYKEGKLLKFICERCGEETITKLKKRG